MSVQNHLTLVPCRFLFAFVLGIAFASRCLAAVGTWDGGNGMWTDPNWNGGLEPILVFSTDQGIKFGDEFVIGGGSHVVYLAGPSGVDHDFVLDSQGGPCRGTIKEGAVLELRTEEASDGLWTEWDGDLILDNGTLRRTFQSGTGAATSGALMFGSWNTAPLNNHAIQVQLLNGSRIENHGMVMFGAWNESGGGLDVHVTVNNGTIDLTGGDTFVLNDTSDQNADLHFYYGTDNATGNSKNESYIINFTGPGSIVVDQTGIRIHTIGADYSTWEHEAVTYQQLWDRGIVRANGASGLTGANFNEFFAVTNSPGTNDYTLRSLLGTGIDGDFNNDGMYNCQDINALTNAVATSGSLSTYDLNGDGQLSILDVDTWRSEAGTANLGTGRSYRVGDANLDGVVDGSDFGIWNSSKFTSNTAWCSGNFNADAVVDGTDFGLWNSNKFMSSDSSLVPEPASILGLLAVAAFACRFGRPD